MAKIKFPLKMKDGAQVRTIEELREHFDLESVLGYYDRGKLVEWLTDHYYDEEAGKIAKLDSATSDFRQQMCEILGVKYSEDKVKQVDYAKIKGKNERLEHLKKYTYDNEVLEAVDSVAFSQDEMIELLKSDVKVIYLCGEMFAIPERIEGIKYIGVNRPKAYVPESYLKGIEDIDFKEGFQYVELGMSDVIQKVEATSNVQLAKPEELWCGAAEQGEILAQLEMVSCCQAIEETGEAFSWLQKAAEQGDADAQFYVGWCYANGKNGAEQNEKEAVNWYRKAAEQGNISAQNNLGVCYENGTGVIKDKKKSVYWYRQAAEQGNASAQYNLGVCYENGTGVEEDEEEAVYWYQQAAEQGYVEAQYRLGVCYENGAGVEEDEKEAVYWYQQAAEQGHAEAQYNLGVCYENGTGIRKDKKKSAYWYRQAAEQEHAEAQYNLGVCYENGIGVKEDEEEAAYWYQQAAEQEHAEAQYNLGVCYENGTGVEEDEEEAVYWYQKAAEQGYAEAQYNLGVCYENGTGVEEDEEEAAYLLFCKLKELQFSRLLEVDLLVLQA